MSMNDINRLSHTSWNCKYHMECMEILSPCARFHLPAMISGNRYRSSFSSTKADAGEGEVLLAMALLPAEVAAVIAIYTICQKIEK